MIGQILISRKVKSVDMENYIPENEKDFFKGC